MAELLEAGRQAGEPIDVPPCAGAAGVPVDEPGGATGKRRVHAAWLLESSDDLTRELERLKARLEIDLAFGKLGREMVRASEDADP